MKDVKNKVIIPTIILSIVAFFSALTLSQIKKVTEKDIQRQAVEKEIKALKMVLPGYTIDPVKDKETVKLQKKNYSFWIGTDKETKETGYAFITSLPGYSGDVRSMVGVNKKGNVIGISILKQTETPGLGARCQEIASSYSFFTYLLGDISKIKKNTVPWFQQQFSGLNLGKKLKILKKGDWNKKMQKELIEQNAISAITGATVTSKVVLDSIKHGYKQLTMALKKASSKKKKKKK